MPEVKVAARNGNLQSEGQEDERHESARATAAAQPIPQAVKLHPHPIKLHAHSPTLQPGCGEIMPTIA
jgi:hypothetical protein